jgi:hypothetical protein
VAHRGTAAAATTSASMRRPAVMRSRATDGMSASECQGKRPDQAVKHRSDGRECREPSTLWHLGFQPVQKTSTIHVSSGFIWGIPVKTNGQARGAARCVEGTGINDLRPLADSLDTYARQIHLIAEIIRSIEGESAEQSTEAKAAENTAPCILHDGQQHLTSTPVISETLDRTPVIEAHAAPVVDTISPEAIWQRVLGARKATEARTIESMPDKVYQDGCAAVGGELGFEDQRVASVAALDPNFRLPFNSRRGDLPQDLIAIGSAEEKPGQNARPLVDLADKGDGPESAQHGLRDADMDLAAWYPRARNDYVNLYCVRRRQPPGDTGSERPTNRSLDRSPGHV